MLFRCRLTLHATLKLLLLSVISLCFFVISLNFDKNRSPIITLGPAFTMIESNGKIHIDDLNGFEEVSDEQKIYLMDKLRNSIHDLMKNCSDSVKPSECRVASKGRLLTLFTTWVYDETKFSVNNKTLYNWKMLPNVKLIVFAGENDFKVRELSQKAGWDVLPITAEAAGTPLLSRMFLDVMNKYDSRYYGFANGDILFTDKLINTLEQISCNIDNGALDDKNGVLVVGRRVNVPEEKLPPNSALSWWRLEEIANQYGELFQSDAEDYFITDSKYPWDTFLPVVVGRRAFDNWVVAYSRFKNITVIDASESIQCVHQTIKSRGNFEGLGKGMYNIELIENQNMPFTFEWGHTYCTKWKTWYDLCKRLMITERKSVLPTCTDFKFSYKLASFFGLA